MSSRSFVVSGDYLLHLLACAVAWLRDWVAGGSKSMHIQCFLASAAAGRQEVNSNWSIHCVFKDIVVDNRRFPLIPAMFFIHRPWRCAA